MRAGLIVGVALSVALVVASSAAAKEFRPGDLRVCNAKQRVPVTDQDTLNALGSMYYGGPIPPRASAPRLRTPYFELKFTNGYVTGIVATKRLDRFLSYGVNLDQFERGRWYRVPAVAARKLQRLATGLKPMRLTRAAVAKSR